MAQTRLAALVVLVAAAVCAAACEPRPGGLRATRDFSNDHFRVRVQVFDEGNRAHWFSTACHVRLLSAPATGETWRQFGNAYDGSCDIDVEGRVRFVSDRVAYVYLQWWYAVTVDGGARWHTFDVAARLPERVHYNPRLIEDVTLAPDGVGTMTLNPAAALDGTRLTLRTNDYGVVWTLP